MNPLIRNTALLLLMLALGLLAGHGAQRLRAYYDRVSEGPRAGDYSALIAQGDAPVVLFSTPSCPYCKMAKEFLAQNRIPYRDVDVLTEEGKHLFEGQGGKAVPLVMTAGMRMQGFLEPEYRKYLLPLAVPLAQD